MIIRRSRRVRLDGAVALVTGASGGIGAAVATGLAGAGAAVVVHGRDPDRTRRVAESIGAMAVTANLAASQGRDDVIAAALDAFGRVDILVNNAGIGWHGPLTQMGVDDIRRVIEVDLLAPLELTRALLPAMVDRRFGAVCFVSSIAGRIGVAGEAVYAAAKAGVDIFAESLRAETVGSGVMIGVVIPGAVSTGFFAARGHPYDRARPKPVSPDAVADAVVRTIVEDRAQAWIPRWLQIAPAVRAVAPGTYRRLAARFGEPVRVRPR